MVIDRNKYMDAKEARQLRTVTEARAIVDLRAGRELGVRAWMLVDLALSTGLRVSEIAALNIRDVDLKRGCLSVVRRNNPALGNAIDILWGLKNIRIVHSSCFLAGEGRKGAGRCSRSPILSVILSPSSAPRSRSRDYTVNILVIR